LGGICGAYGCSGRKEAPFQAGFALFAQSCKAFESFAGCLRLTVCLAQIVCDV